MDPNMDVKPRSNNESYESCVAQLMKGKPVTALSNECRVLLGAANLSRWNSNMDTFSKRLHQGDHPMLGGPAHDVVQDPKQELSVSQLYLQSKSPEAQAMVKQKIARTASQGGKVRCDDIICQEDVERERNKIAQQRQEVRKVHRLT
jgi:hypothetical protein